MRNRVKVFVAASLCLVTFSACKSADEEIAELELEELPAEKPPEPGSPKAAPTTAEQPDKTSPSKGLPLPEKTTYYALKQFMDEYRDVYAAYIPLGKEYRMYFKGLNDEDEPSEEVLAALKLRMRENFDRAHWVFLGAVLELSEFFQQNARNMLQIDKEENFVARVRVITFMANELKEISKDARYVNFARALYISMSEKHLGRTVKPREDKKEEKDTNLHEDAKPEVN